MELNTALVLLVALLMLASLLQRLAAQTTFPASILLAAAGAVIGGVSMLAEHVTWDDPVTGAVKAFIDLPLGSDVFLYVFLPVLLFQAALTIEVRQIVADAAPILVLAIVAVVVATAIIGFALAPIAGVPLVVCLLLGSIVATTDPVAVIGIFRDVGAPARLTRLVGGESLLNDAAAITLFGALLGILQSTAGGSAARTARSFLWAFAGGAVAGVVAARVALRLLVWLRDLKFAQVTLTLTLPYLVFIGSEQAVGVSGVVAAVAAGLVCSASGEVRVPPAEWRFLNDVWEQLAFWASCLLFLLAALVVPGLLAGASWRDAALLATLVGAALVARALVLFGLLPALSGLGLAERIDHRYKIAILWGGLRGEVLEERRQMVDGALGALRGQYAGFVDGLEHRFLRRLALRREEVEYGTLSQERLIGPELDTALRREVRAARLSVESRPGLDLGLETRALVRQIPLFADLDAQQIAEIARVLWPRIAMPGERLISEGERGDCIYFIASGEVEAVAAGRPFRLTRGNFFGEMALVLHMPRQANVTAVTRCQLLLLGGRDLRALFRQSPGIKRQIDETAAARARINEVAARRPSSG